MSVLRNVNLFVGGFAVASIPAYYQLHQDLYRTQDLVNDSVTRLRETVQDQTKEMQKRVNQLEGEIKAIRKAESAAKD